LVITTFTKPHRKLCQSELKAFFSPLIYTLVSKLSEIVKKCVRKEIEVFIPSPKGRSKSKEYF